MNRVGILKQILVICNVLGTSSGYSMDNNTYSSPIKSFNRNFFVKSNGQSPVKSDPIVKQQLLNQQDDIKELEGYIRELFRKLNNLSTDVTGNKIVISEVISKMQNDKQIEELLKKVDELSYEVSVLTDSDNNEIPLLKSKISDLSTQLNQFDWKIDEVSNNSEKVTELLEEVKELSDKLKKNDKLIGDMIDDIQGLSDKIGNNNNKELSEEVKELSIKVNNSNNNEQITELLNKVKELSDKVNILSNQDTSQEDNNNEQVNQLLKEVKELSDKVNDFAKDILNATVNSTLAHDKVKSFTEQFSEKIDNLSKQVNGLEKNKADIKDLSKNVQQDIQSLRDNLHSVQTDISSCWFNLTELSKQVTSDNSNNNEQNNKQNEVIQKNINDIKDLRKDIGSLIDNVNEFGISSKRSSNILGDRMNNIENKVKQLEKQTDDSSNNNENNNKQVELLQKQVDDLNLKVNNSSSNNYEQVKQLLEQVNKLSSEVNDLSNKVNDLSKQVNNSNGSNNNNEQVKRLLKKVNDLSKQVNNSNGSNNNEQVKRLLKKVSDLSNQVNNNNNGSNNYEQIEQLLKQVNNLSKQVKKVNDSNVNDKLDAWELSSLSIRMKNLENLFRNVNRNVFMNINSIYEQMEKQVDEKVDERIGKLQKQVDDFYNILSTSFESLDNLKNELNIKDIREQIVLFLEKDTKKYTLSSSQYCFYKERIYKDRNGIIKDLIDKKLINHTIKNTNDANNTNDTYEISNKITDVDYFKYLIEINSFALDNHQIIIKRLEDNLKNILSNSLFKNNIQFMVDKIEKQSNDLKIIIGEYKELETQVLNLLNTNKARNENLNKTFNEIASKYEITNKKIENMYNNFYQFLIIKHA